MVINKFIIQCYTHLPSNMDGVVCDGEKGYWQYPMKHFHQITSERREKYPQPHWIMKNHQNKWGKYYKDFKR